MKKCAIIHANFEMPSMKISDFNTLHSAKLFTSKYESTQQLGSKQNFTCLGLNTFYKNILHVKKICDYMDSAYAAIKRQQVITYFEKFLSHYLLQNV